MTALPVGWESRKAGAIIPEGEEVERTGEWSAYFLDQKYGETSVEQPDSVPLLWNNRKNSVPLEILKLSKSAVDAAVAETVAPGTDFLSSGGLSIAAKTQSNLSTTSSAEVGSSAGIEAVKAVQETIGVHHDEQMQLLKLLANVVVGIDSKMNALDAKVDTALQRLDKMHELQEKLMQSIK